MLAELLLTSTLSALSAADRHAEFWAERAAAARTTSLPAVTAQHPARRSCSTPPRIAAQGSITVPAVIETNEPVTVADPPTSADTAGGTR